MKKMICLFLVIVVSFSLSCCAAPKEVSFSDDSKAIQIASNSVIMLSCYNKNGDLYATGSAFAAFEQGVFITNYHVIKDETYSIKAQMEAGLEFNISTIIAYDEERDLAILWTEEKTSLEPLPLGHSSALEKGEKVIAIGSPLGLINTVSVGLFSGTIKEEQAFLQFSAAISHGSSGGALFNNKGEVVGITSASFTEGQNLNLAIPIEDAINLWNNRDEKQRVSITDFYVEFIPSLPSELIGKIDVKTLGFEEFKKQVAIAEELGLGNNINDLLSEGYRFYRVPRDTVLMDKEYSYHLDLAIKLGLTPEIAKEVISQGYRFYFYD